MSRRRNRCQGCRENWRTHRHNSFDNRGSILIHDKGDWTDPEYEFMHCANQTFISRHYLATTSVVGILLVFVIHFLWNVL
jgi:hypothetical protein